VADYGQVKFKAVAVAEPATDLYAAAGGQRADAEQLAGDDYSLAEAWASMSPSPNRESPVCGLGLRRRPAGERSAA